MGSFGSWALTAPSASGDLDALLEGGSVASLDDAALLGRVAWGSRALADPAFAALVGRYGGLVARVCGGVLGDHHAAEDAAQAVFLVLHARAGSLQRPDRLANWLHGVALRTARHARRRTRRALLDSRTDQPTLPETSTMPDPADALIARERAEILHAVIGGLPGHYRTALILCDLQGWTHTEAAAHLGCPVATLSSRVLRAREQLRARLARRRLDLTQLPPLIGPAPLAVLGALGGFVRSGLPRPAAQALAHRATWLGFGAQSKAIVAAALLAGLASFGLAGDGPPAPSASVALLAQDPRPAAVATPSPTPTPTPVAPEGVVQDPPPAVEPIRVGLPVRRAVPRYAVFDGLVAATRTVEVRPAVSGLVHQSRELAEGDPVGVGEGLFTIEERSDAPQVQQYQREVAAVRDQAVADLEVLGDQIVAIDRRIQPLLAANQGRPIQDVSLRSEVERVANLREQCRTTTARRDDRLKTLESRFEQDAERRRVVRAPFAGVLTGRFPGEGATVEANQTALATIAAVDPIRVDFTVGEGEYNAVRRWLRLHPDQTHVVVHVGLINEAGYPHLGRARFQAGQFERSAQGVQATLHAEVANPERTLVPGQTARVVVEFGDPHPATLVPVGALSSPIWFPGTEVGIWKVDATGKVGVWVVTAGLPTTDGLVEIRDPNGAVGSAPIEPTTRIVVSGADRVQPDTILPPATGGEGGQPQ